MVVVRSTTGGQRDGRKEVGCWVADNGTRWTSIVGESVRDCQTNLSKRGTTMRRTTRVLSLAMAALVLLGVEVAQGAIVLDLADIVGGGDGTGTGSNQGIDPRNGNIVTSNAPSMPVVGATLPNVTFNTYSLVTSNPFIDGVFIPDGGVANTAAIPVSSTGLTVTGIADAADTTWDYIMNGPNTGVPVVHPTTSLLGMHTNKGITFDLDSIATAHPGFEVSSFGTLAMIERYDALGNAAFYVVIDGLIRQQAILTGSGTMALTVPLGQDDRFLTLITSDNGDITWDHSVFGDPFLTLTESAAVVPEPTALAIWGTLGGLGVITARRRRRTA